MLLILLIILLSVVCVKYFTSKSNKYNRANGQIYISCIEIPSEQPEMTMMEFVCRDTGIGMTEEFQKCVFEPFAQEHTGKNTKEKKHTSYRGKYASSLL